MSGKCLKGAHTISLDLSWRTCYLLMPNFYLMFGVANIVRDKNRLLQIFNII